jgi:hypothetical protein
VAVDRYVSDSLGIGVDVSDGTTLGGTDAILVGDDVEEKV